MLDHSNDRPADSPNAPLEVLEGGGRRPGFGRCYARSVPPARGGRLGEGYVGADVAGGAVAVGGAALAEWAFVAEQFPQVPVELDRPG